MSQVANRTVRLNPNSYQLPLYLFAIDCISLECALYLQFTAKKEKNKRGGDVRGSLYEREEKRRRRRKRKKKKKKNNYSIKKRRKLIINIRRSSALWFDGDN